MAALRGEAGVGAAQLLRHVRVALGEALDVQLVDERLVPGGTQAPVVAPGEGGVDDRGEGSEGRAIALVEGQVAAGPIL